MQNSLQWFLNRIGKRIFRDDHKCCNHCEDVFSGGLVIHDRSHAMYLYDTQNDFLADGIELNYRDTK